eukprot:1193358-Prorocentrum_minimum.AAC.1
MCARLSRLSLRWCGRLSEEGLRALYSLSGLMTLDLTECTRVSDRVLHEVARILLISVHYCSLT